MPETHRLFYLSTSISDFWRRIKAEERAAKAAERARLARLAEGAPEYGPGVEHRGWCCSLRQPFVHHLLDVRGSQASERNTADRWRNVPGDVHAV